MLFVTPKRLAESPSLLAIFDSFYSNRGESGGEERLLSRFVIDEAHCLVTTVGARLPARLSPSLVGFFPVSEYLLECASEVSTQGAQTRMSKVYPPCV